MSSPLLWGPNQVATNLENSILQGNGSLLAYNGVKNYISYGTFENGLTTGWSLLTTTLTGVLPTGSLTLSAASLNALAVTTTNPLSGNYSLQTVSSGVWAAGQGIITQVYNLDREDYLSPKVLSFKASYEIVSGAANVNQSGTSSNTFAVYFYDVTNSAWVQPAGVYNMVGNGIITGTVQFPSTCTQFRMAILAVNASGGATTIKWDDFSFGPQVSPLAPAMSDTTSYTPTYTTNNAVGVIGNGTVTGEWRRVGDSAEITIVVVVGSTTTFSGGSGVLISLPAGLVIDTSKLAGGTSSDQILGAAEAFDSSANTRYAGEVLYSTTTGVNFCGPNTVGFWSSTNPFTWATSDVIAGTFRVPIVGWSSNTVSSADTDTRVVAAILSGNPATASANGIVIYPTVTKDTHGAYNASTGRYTAPVSGFYQIDAFLSCNVASGVIRLQTYLDAVAQSPGMGTDGTAISEPHGSTMVYANAGQLIDVRVSAATGAVNSSVLNGMTIQRVSGPAVVQASEKVYLQYTGNAGTSITANVTNIDFSTKVTDSHLEWNGTTFTAPRPGWYDIEGCVQITASTSSNYFIYVNGVQKYFIGMGNLSSANKCFAGGTYLNQGDVMSIRSDSSETLSNSATSHWIAIRSQG